MDFFPGNIGCLLFANLTVTFNPKINIFLLNYTPKIGGTVATSAKSRRPHFYWAKKGSKIYVHIYIKQESLCVGILLGDTVLQSGIFLSLNSQQKAT